MPHADKIEKLEDMNMGWSPGRGVRCTYHEDDGTLIERWVDRVEVLPSGALEFFWQTSLGDPSVGIVQVIAPGEWNDLRYRCGGS